MTTTPPEARGKMRLGIRVAALALPFVACYQAIEAPSCRTVADCPSGQGYSACEDGYCFTKGHCDGKAPVAGDGCCAVTEGDRTPDTDCLVADLDLGCRDPAGPVADALGGLFVTCRSVDAMGISTVVLKRIDSSGTAGTPEVVGPASVILPPLVSRGTDVYVAYAGGVVRRDAATGLLTALESESPIGGLASTGDGDGFHSVVGWPTASGTVVLYDEFAAATQVFTAGPTVPGTTGVFPPTVSSSGRRMYVLWHDGTLHSIETATSPRGAVSSVVLPAHPVAPPVEVDGRIFVALEGGTLIALAERRPDFVEVWTQPLSLGGEVVGGLLVDPTGAVTAVLASGDVVVVRDLVDRGSLVGRGNFGVAVGGLYPFLGAAPRVVAVTANGTGVTSLLRQDDGGGMTFDAGLSFGIPVAIVGAPLLIGRQLWMVTRSQRLVAWQFPDDLPAGRFVRAGADAGGTGRTTAAVP